MDEYKIQKSTLDDIADAINAKTGENGQMSPSEMVEKIASIPSGGGKGGDYNIVQTIDGDNCSLAITDANTFVLATKTVSANGTYAAAADDNADGYRQVTVAIPIYDGSVI